MGISTVTIALIFAILGMGVFISFRILNITDLTVEASYGFGAAISGLLCLKHLPYLALAASFFGGCFAGLITSLLHTKLKVNAILSGILTLTAFYSVNLIVTNSKTTMSLMENGTPLSIFPDNAVAKLVISFIIVLITGLLLSFFFKTKPGLSLRAVGDNEQMSKTQCISADLMKITGLMLSNGLVALAGGLFVQFQNAYFTNIERGTMVVGVATIIIGEVLTFKKHSIDLMLAMIVVGSIIYRFVYGFALELDFIKTRDLELVKTLFLIAILGISVISEKIKDKKNQKKMLEQLAKEE